MKKIDLNTSKDLSKVMTEMNIVFQARIEEAKKKELQEEAKNLSLYSLCDIFEGLSDNLYRTKGGKKVIAEYIKAIKENKSVRSAYNFRSFVKEATYTPNTPLFLNEAIDFYKESYNAKELREGTKKIGNIVAKILSESGMASDEIENLLSTKNTLNESLAYIFESKKTPTNLNQYVSNFATVVEHIDSRKEECINESRDIDEAYAELQSLCENSAEDWEKKIIEDITLTKLAGKNLSTVFESYKNDCLSLISESIENCEDTENRARFSTMKVQLEGKTFSSETIAEDILKLAELKNTLTE